MITSQQFMIHVVAEHIEMTVLTIRLIVFTVSN